MPSSSGMVMTMTTAGTARQPLAASVPSSPSQPPAFSTANHGKSASFHHRRHNHHKSQQQQHQQHKSDMQILRGAEIIREQIRKSLEASSTVSSSAASTSRTASLSSYSSNILQTTHHLRARQDLHLQQLQQQPERLHHPSHQSFLDQDQAQDDDDRILETIYQEHASLSGQNMHQQQDRPSQKPPTSASPPHASIIDTSVRTVPMVMQTSPVKNGRDLGSPQQNTSIPTTTANTTTTSTTTDPDSDSDIEEEEDTFSDPWLIQEKIPAPMRGLHRPAASLAVAATPNAQQSPVRDDLLFVSSSSSSCSSLHLNPHDATNSHVPASLLSPPLSPRSLERRIPIEHKPKKPADDSLSPLHQPTKQPKPTVKKGMVMLQNLPHETSVQPSTETPAGTGDAGSDAALSFPSAHDGAHWSELLSLGEDWSPPREHDDNDDDSNVHDVAYLLPKPQHQRHASQSASDSPRSRSPWGVLSPSSKPQRRPPTPQRPRHATPNKSRSVTSCQPTPPRGRFRSPTSQQRSSTPPGHYEKWSISPPAPPQTPPKSATSYEPPSPASSSPDAYLELLPSHISNSNIDLSRHLSRSTKAGIAESRSRANSVSKTRSPKITSIKKRRRGPMEAKISSILDDSSSSHISFMGRDMKIQSKSKTYWVEALEQHDAPHSDEDDHPYDTTTNQHVSHSPLSPPQQGQTRGVRRLRAGGRDGDPENDPTVSRGAASLYDFVHPDYDVDPDIVDQESATSASFTSLPTSTTNKTVNEQHQSPRLEGMSGVIPVSRRPTAATTSASPLNVSSRSISPRRILDSLSRQRVLSPQPRPASPAPSAPDPGIRSQASKELSHDSNGVLPMNRQQSSMQHPSSGSLSKITVARANDDVAIVNSASTRNNNAETITPKHRRDPGGSDTYLQLVVVDESNPAELEIRQGPPLNKTKTGAAAVRTTAQQSVADVDEVTSATPSVVTRNSVSSSISPMTMPLPAKVPTPLSIEYDMLMQDPAYRHAQNAGYLWQSIVGQHVRFPSRWWNGERGPPLGLSDTASAGKHRWDYYGRYTIGTNPYLNRLIRHRGSQGLLLLHIIVQDLMTCRAVQDVVVGCFHPNARGIRGTDQADPHLESCRDIWLAVRKRSSKAVSVIDPLLIHPDSPRHASMTPGLPEVTPTAAAVKSGRSPLSCETGFYDSSSGAAATAMAASMAMSSVSSSVASSYYGGTSAASAFSLRRLQQQQQHRPDRITNNNVRAVFGDKPPLETMFMPESELYERLASGHNYDELPPPLVLLEAFVFV